MKTVVFALSLAGLSAMLAGPPASADEPFAAFAGTWRGAGRVFDIHGASEALSCKSSNAPSPDGIAMTLSLVCASDSYRVDFHADLYTDGEKLRGTWSETTRNATGNVSGSIAPDVIRATTSAPGFTAHILVHVVSDKRLDVSLDAQGTSVNRVQVSMKR